MRMCYINLHFTYLGKRVRRRRIRQHPPLSLSPI